MAKASEPNAQNSELNENTHPSGARIEKMMNKTSTESGAKKPGVDKSWQESSFEDPETGSPAPSIEKDVERPVDGPEKGTHGETLRPSERYTPPEDPVEGARDQQPSAPHRHTPDDRSDM